MFFSFGPVKSKLQKYARTRYYKSHNLLQDDGVGATPDIILTWQDQQSVPLKQLSHTPVWQLLFLLYIQGKWHHQLSCRKIAWFSWMVCTDTWKVIIDNSLFIDWFANKYFQERGIAKIWAFSMKHKLASSVTSAWMKSSVLSTSEKPKQNFPWK